MQKINNIWKIYIGALTVFIIIAAASAFYPHDQNSFMQGVCTVIDRNVICEGSRYNKPDEIMLPQSVSMKKGKDLKLSVKLPAYIDDGEYLFIYAGKTDVDVYINGDKVGKCLRDKYEKYGVKVPARWSETELSRNYSGGLLQAVFRSNDSDRTIRLERIYIGDRSAIIWHILFSYMPIIVSAVIITAMGLIITLFDILNRRKEYIYMGIAMLLLGINLLGIPEFRQIYIRSLTAADMLRTPLIIADIAALCLGIYEMRDRFRDRMVLMCGQIFAAVFAAGVLFRIVKPYENIYMEIVCAGFLIICGCFTYHFFKYMMGLKREQQNAVLLNEEKDAFLADMSHAVRTPVNTIIGMNTMILRESRDDRTKDYASDISNAADALISIIDEILDFSKTSPGRTRITESDYEMSSLVNDCYNMIGYKVKNKGLEFGISNNPGIPLHLYGDEARIRQIVVNLLTNAVKYTNKGRVDFSIDFEPVSDNTVIIIFKVVDTGIGIREEDIGKIFDGFERTENEENLPEEGNGLGLKIAKDLAVLMNGSIDVESRQGQGSEFTVRIPQKYKGNEKTGSCSERIRQHNENAEKNHKSFRAPDARVLVTDDVEMNLKVMQALLKNTGMTIETAGSGSEALEMIASKRYDIIFLDHMMPVMDGIETFRRMKKMPENPNSATPVIILTANAIKGAKEKYLAEGFDDYIAKPVEEKELVEICCRYLEPSLVTEDMVPGNGSTDSTEEYERIISQLSGMLNIKEGMAYCVGKEDFYFEMLGDYAKSVYFKKLDQCFKDGDFDNYRINAHTIKSSARTLGANNISEEARQLEYAAKDGDISYIRENHVRLIEDNDKLIRYITEVLQTYVDRGITSEKMEIEPEHLKAMLQKAYECAYIFDIDGVEKVIKELNRCDISKYLQEELDKLKNADDEIEFDDMLKIASEMLESLKQQ